MREGFLEIKKASGTPFDSGENWLRLCWSLASLGPHGIQSQPSEDHGDSCPLLWSHGVAKPNDREENGEELPRGRRHGEHESTEVANQEVNRMLAHGIAHAEEDEVLDHLWVPGAECERWEEFSRYHESCSGCQMCSHCGRIVSHSPTAMNNDAQRLEKNII